MIKKVLLLGLLLVPSFSFAVNYTENLGDYEDLGANNNCTINSDLSFDCSESNNVIVGTDTSWYKSSTSYFWTTSGLAVYIHIQNGNDIQGLITSFAIAGNEFPSYSRTISYEDFLTYYNNNELTNWSWAASVSTPGRAGPDFVFGNTHIFFYPITSSSFAGTITPVDFGLVGWGLDADYSNLGVINTPISPKLPDYNINPGQCVRNGDVLMGFEYMGLSREYCYGGFALDNLFLPSESFDDFTGYSFGAGASIFDLHSSYSGGSTMKPFLTSYYQSFINGQLSNFYNKSKALLMLFQQYQSANDREWGSFKLNDLIDYCDLYFDLVSNNYDNDMECYTGPSKSGVDSYNFSRIGRDSNNGGFSFTGVLGGNGTGFSTPDEFFGRLSNLFQTNMRGIDSTFPSMIPSYIVFFMLAIILIRIISH